MLDTVNVIVVGAGDRGTTYAGLAKELEGRMSVAGVAELRPEHRRRFADAYQLPAGRVFGDWKELAAQPRLADAVVIALPDALHVEAAVAFAAKGYHILLEKPMATSPEDCLRIVTAASAAGIILSVCHVMRYTRYTQAVKRMVDSGVLGTIVSLQHLEPVGFWHQAHSFVRGNWRNSQESTFMLLAKSCHDTDWIRYIMARPCARVSSFGSLYHFKPENRPAGAADRCLECGIEANCPYSARRIYMGFYDKGTRGWPVSVVTPEPTPEAIEAALRTGPYGRCVYAGGNDVVDHQVVIMEFADGATANFTMTAFSPTGGRRTHLFGTRGHLYGDGSKLTHFDFLTGEKQEIDTSKDDGTIASGHGGGDFGVLRNFIDSVQAGNPGLVLTGPEVSLESHRIAFAAEESRLTGRVVSLS